MRAWTSPTRPSSRCWAATCAGAGGGGGASSGGSLTKPAAPPAPRGGTKILGFSPRLDMRDGKPQYLRHLPRVWGCLQRSLSHPALEALNAWYIAHVPALNTI